MNKLSLIALFFLNISNSESQTFLNGDFENHSAVGDQINLSNAAFNSFMLDNVGFGLSGNLDIIATSQYSGGPYSGIWYVALTAGETDMLSLKLSTPLVMGDVYSISFYDKRWDVYSGNTIEIGVSSANNAYGSLLYTTSTPPTIGLWTERTFTFTAPSNGQYITVRQSGSPSTSRWVQIDNFTISPSVPLPVQLTEFSAILNENSDVLLSWTTASEMNNDYFTVERSMNGNDWESIENIDGAGTTSTSMNYSAIDRDPYVGISYYRLKQIDFNGQFSYSEISTVNQENHAGTKIELYPNPVLNELNINGDPFELTELEIYTLLGQDVTLFTNKFAVNDRMLRIDVSNLNQGVYYVKTKNFTKLFYKQ